MSSPSIHHLELGPKLWAIALALLDGPLLREAAFLDIAEARSVLLGDYSSSSSDWFFIRLFFFRRRFFGAACSSVELFAARL